MTKDDRYGATDDDYGDAMTSGTMAQTGGETSVDEEDDASEESDALPFIFARRTVKADREAVPVYVQDDTAADIGEVERQLGQEFDGDKVMALDVREALVRVGLQNVDDVESVMREWGYGRR
jgi:hypothetical protein